MKPFLLIMCLLSLLVSKMNVANAQVTNQDIILEVTDFHKTKDSITFKLSLKNISDENLAIFKPNIEYVNYGLFSICLIKESDSTKFYFNHGKKGDIDNIFLDQEDYIILGEQESYIKQFNLPIKEFIPRVPEGSFKIELMLDYSIVNFTFPCKIKAQVFKGKAHFF